MIVVLHQMIAHMNVDETNKRTWRDAALRSRRRARSRFGGRTVIEVEELALIKPLETPIESAAVALEKCYRIVVVEHAVPVVGRDFERADQLNPRDPRVGV